MAKMKYTAKIGAHTEDEGENEVEVAEVTYGANYDFGDNLAACAEKFGDAVVFKNAVAQLTLQLYRTIRTAGKVANSTAKSIQAAVDAWVPGVITRKTKDPVATAMSAVAGMSDEQKAAFIAALESEG